MATATLAPNQVLAQELIDEGHRLWNPEKPLPFTFNRRGTRTDSLYRQCAHVNKGKGSEGSFTLVTPVYFRPLAPLPDRRMIVLPSVLIQRGWMRTEKILRDAPVVVWDDLLATVLPESHPLRQWVNRHARFMHVREMLIEGFDHVVIGPESSELSEKSKEALNKRKSKCAISMCFPVARRWAKWGQRVTLPDYWLLKHDVMFGRWGLLMRDVYRSNVTSKHYGSKRTKMRTATDEDITPVTRSPHSPWSPKLAKRAEGRLFLGREVVAATHEPSEQAKKDMWFYRRSNRANFVREYHRLVSSEKPSDGKTIVPAFWLMVLQLLGSRAK